MVKPVAKKPVAKKTTAKKTVAVKKPVKKPVVKKIAKKTAPVKTAPVKAVSVKSAPVKVAPVKSEPAKTVPVPPVAATPPAPLGIPEQMRDAALKVLDERKAEDIVTLPLVGRSSVADYMIIASGRAGRQISAIAGYLREEFFKLGVRNVRVEGQAEGNWVLIDGGDIIVHLFRPEVRKYYDLDAIWSGKIAP